MNFGHIVLEGYCMHTDEQDEVPCKGKYAVSEKCFMEQAGVCLFFGWCRAKNLIIVTDGEGNGIKGILYDDEKKKEVVQKVNDLLPESDEEVQNNLV